MDRKVAIQKLEAELKKWGVNIEKFRTQAAKTKSSTKATVQGKIEDLRSKQKKAQEKLKKLRAGGEGAWIDLKRGTEKALADLRVSVRKAAGKFKK